MDSSDKFIITFKYLLKKNLISEVKGMVLSRPISFDDLFNTYFKSEVIGIDDPSYSKKALFDFINQAQDFDLLSFNSKNEGEKLTFALFTNSDGSRNVVLYKEDNKKAELGGSTDFLTHTNSREKVYNLIEEKLAKDTKNSYLIMVDLDNFKNMNDSYGHLIGDACLKNIATILNEYSSDLIFGRYGGDEFIIYCSNVTEERLNKLIDDVLHIKYSLNKTSKNTSFVTCSMGIAKVSGQAKNLNDLIKNADSALYESKKVGKNTATFYRGPQTKGPLNNVSTYHRVNKNYKYTFFDEELRNRTINTIIRLGIVALLIIGGCIGFNFIYDYTIDKNITNMAMSLSNDISNEVTFIVNNKIEQVYSNLLIGKETIDAASFDGEIIDYLNKEIDSLKKSGIADNPGILLSTGQAYFGNNFYVNIASSEGARHLIIDKKNSLSKINLGLNEDSILFGVPYSKTLVGNTGETYEVAAVLNYYGINEFASSIIGFISQTSNRYVAILDENGSKICESDSQMDEFAFLVSKNNILNAFNDDSFTKELLNNILKSGSSIQYYVDGDTKIYFYTDDIEFVPSWKLLIATDKTYVNKYFENNVIQNKIVVISFITIIIFSLALYAFYSLRLQKESFSAKYLDPLTKTINANRLIIDARKAIKDVYDNKYVVYLLVSNIQVLNEIKGIEKGNEIFYELAQILSSEIFGKEIISRFFSDSFVLILNSSNTENLISRMKEVSDKCQRKIESRYKFALSFRAGIYNFQSRDEPIWLAIDRAKSVSEHDEYRYSSFVVSVFDKKELEKEELRAFIEHSQQQALQNNEFDVYYQGIYNLKEKKFKGAEALCRWHSEKRTMIRPDAFIPLFEKNGFIIDLDLYVFETVCKDIRASIDKGIDIEYVSINLSKMHFANNNFFDQYISIMNKYNLSGKYFVFEITESLAFEKDMRIEKMLKNIHSVGSQIAIDDFGTGYSNLSVLIRVDFDIIKLDKSILGNERNPSPDRQKFIKSIVDLCFSLNKRIIFEGVESEEQSNFLASLGVENIQGYYYSYPLPKSEYYRKFKKEVEEN